MDLADVLVNSPSHLVMRKRHCKSALQSEKPQCEMNASMRCVPGVPVTSVSKHPSLIQQLYHKTCIKLSLPHPMQLLCVCGGGMADAMRHAYWSQSCPV